MHPRLVLSGMRKEIHDTEAYVVVSAEDFIEDNLHGDEFAGVGDRYLSIAGSHGDPGKYPADLVDAQRGAKSETT